MSKKAREYVVDNRHIYTKIVLVNRYTKRPAQKWKTETATDLQVFQHYGNYAWKLAQCDLVIDVDVKNNARGLQSLTLLFENSNIKESDVYAQVQTPSGGLHYYFKLPKSTSESKYRLLKKNHKIYPDIDFLSIGDICMCAGNVLKFEVYNKIIFKKYEQIQTDLSQPMIPSLLFDHLKNLTQSRDRAIKNKYYPPNPNTPHTHITNMFNKETDAYATNISTTNSLISSQEIKQYLDNQDYNDYNNWILLGLALKNYDIEKGYSHWLEWSRQATTFKSDAECAYKWTTFDAHHPSPITLAGLMNYNLFNSSEEAFESIVFDAKTIKSYEDLNNKFNQKRLYHLSSIETDIVIGVISKQLKKIGFEVTATTLKHMLKAPKFEPQLIEICKNYIYLKSLDKFMDISRLQFTQSNLTRILLPFFSYQGFQNENASEFCIRKGFIRSYDDIISVDTDEDVINDKKSLLYNIFNIQKTLFIEEFEDIPIETQEYFELAYRLFKNIHILILGGQEEVFQALWDYLCWVVAKPTKRVGWLPIIQGLSGAGKTLVANILCKMLGYKNSSIVNNAQLNSRFNTWNDPIKLFICFEEAKLTTYDNQGFLISSKTAEEIKLFITSDMQTVEHKGKDSTSQNTVANSILLTNARNPVLLFDENDRRYLLCEIKETKQHELCSSLKYLLNKEFNDSELSILNITYPYVSDVDFLESYFNILGGFVDKKQLTYLLYQRMCAECPEKLPKNAPTTEAKTQLAKIQHNLTRRI